MSKLTGASQSPLQMFFAVLRCIEQRERERFDLCWGVAQKIPAQGLAA